VKSDKTTHFGYEAVPVTEKAQRVRAVFDSVADNYDVMNDLMSLGIHRLWKRYTVDLAGIRPGMRILDLAGGTGDMTRLMSPLAGPEGRVILSDINAAMLARGRATLLDRGISGNVSFAQINAEQLPFADTCLDRVTIAFGLRNVTDKQRALNEMARVLRPGGQPTISTRSVCCRSLAGWSRAMRTVTATWRNRFACTPTRTRCSACWSRPAWNAANTTTSAAGSSPYTAATAFDHGPANRSPAWNSRYH
jgi:ubiquinone/menaquinone biosynthesis C-methylase UbiE